MAPGSIAELLDQGRSDFAFISETVPKHPRLAWHDEVIAICRPTTSLRGGRIARCRRSDVLRGEVPARRRDLPTSKKTTQVVASLESLIVTGRFRRLDAPAAGRHSTSQALGGLRARELWRYRELLVFLAWRDLKVRYKQTVFGVVWAVLQPLLYMVVFTLFFGHSPTCYADGCPTPLFALSGSCSGSSSPTRSRRRRTASSATRR